jgi:hypothetical protein
LHLPKTNYIIMVYGHLLQQVQGWGIQQTKTIFKKVTFVCLFVPLLI